MDEREFFLELARRLDPKDAQGFNNLGVVLYNKGYVAEAAEAFRRALDADPTFHLARRNLESALKRLGEGGHAGVYPQAETRDAKLAAAVSLERMGRLDEAADIYMDVLKAYPDDVDALLGMARVLVARTDYREAEDFLRRVVELDPGRAEAWKLLGDVHYRLHDLDQALRDLKRAAELAPDSAEVYYSLSFIYGELGMTEEAAEAMEKAVAMNPSLGEPQEAFSIEDEVPGPAEEADPLRTRLELAEAYLSKGLFDDAERELRAAERFVSNEDERKHLETLKGIALLLTGRYQELLESGLEEPNLKALALYKLGREAEALDVLERAAEGDYLSAHNYGVLLYALKGDPVALRYLQRGRDVPQSHYNMALLLLEEGRVEEALEVLEEAERLGKGSPRLKCLRAYAECKRGALDEAERVLLEVLREDPRSPEANGVLTVIYFRRGQFGRFFESVKAGLRPWRRELLAALPLVHMEVPVPPRRSYQFSSLQELEARFDELLERGETEALERAVRELSRQEPFNESLIRMQAVLAFRRGDFEAAAEFFESLKNISFDDAKLYALSEEWLGNYPKALHILIGLIRQRRDDPDLWAWAGRVMFKAKRLREAKIFVGKALSLNRFHPEALYILGELLLGAGRHGEVEKIAQTLLRLGDPRGYIFQGELAFLREDYKGAERALERALEKGAERAKVLYVLGLVAAFRGNFARAFDLWSQVQEISHDRALAAKARQNISQLRSVRSGLLSQVTGRS